MVWRKLSKSIKLRYKRKQAPQYKLEQPFRRSQISDFEPSQFLPDMTQPSGPNQTFDASLIDTQQILNQSFSSTETNTSGSNTDHRPQTSNPPSTDNARMSNPEAFTSVSNDQLYDTWASTYDTDGNVLQAVDDLELKTLLPEFVKLTCQAAANDGDTRPLRILDFGCGTGRNTIKLLQASWHDGGQTLGREVEVHGWDASAGMLDIGRQKTANVSNGKVGLASLQRMDFSSPSNIPTQHHNAFSGILSTLVLEHLPLNTFFTTLATLLAPGGYALVTNMHPAMGRTTKAGFKTESGERVKGESYVHNVEESVLAAREAGLEVVSVDGFGVRERSVDEGMIERGEVGSRGRKWVGVKVWYGLVVRKRGGLNSRERK